MTNHDYNEDKKRESIEQDYIEYIDRCRRNTSKSRLDIHNLKNTRNVGLYYGLTEKELDNFTARFENEEKIKE